MKVAMLIGLEDTFKLTSTISLNNMHLFNEKGSMMHFDTPDESKCSLCLLD